MSSILSPVFFSQDTVSVAKALLGKDICRIQDGVLLRAKIVETEAYLQDNDPAAHCAKALPHLRSGKTLEQIKGRYKVMFGDPGTIYVYFIYGNYFMLNFVTEKRNTAGAVLIRAIEPLEGVDVMRQNRGLQNLNERKIIELGNGPAKLALSLNIDKSLNEKKLGKPDLWVEEGLQSSHKIETVQTTRIGINVGKELEFRFYIKGNRFVSKK